MPCVRLVPIQLRLEYFRRQFEIRLKLASDFPGKPSWYLVVDQIALECIPAGSEA